MKARVYKSTGSWYSIKDENGNFLNARLKGIFKIDNITSTNPIAVGDEVIIEKDNDGVAAISQILPRKNYITRQAPQNRRRIHIIAANLDQTLLFATMKEPRTSQGFLDRFLITSEAYHIPSILVFNKSDIYKAKEVEKYQRLKEIYENAGYKVFLISVKTNEGVEELRRVLADKTTLFSGHSGVGKSSFINYLMPSSILKTQDVSKWSGKGMHTTTFAEMYDLPEGGSIIDTPGIREFALVDISKQELSHFFPEMKNLLNECQFNNCLHIQEPGCAIKKAVEEGIIPQERYDSYCNLFDSIEEANWD